MSRNGCGSSSERSRKSFKRGSRSAPEEFRLRAWLETLHLCFCTFWVFFHCSQSTSKTCLTCGGLSLSLRPKSLGPATKPASFWLSCLFVSHFPSTRPFRPRTFIDLGKLQLCGSLHWHPLELVRLVRITKHHSPVAYTIGLPHPLDAVSIHNGTCFLFLGFQ